MKILIKLKKDRFSARRGGTSKVLDLRCKKCNNLVIVYQKDGPGPLLRCYIDRIIYPGGYKKLQKSKTVNELPRLTCNYCNAIIGVPMRYKEHGENRLAFNMIATSFKKKISTQVKIK